MGWYRGPRYGQDVVPHQGSSLNFNPPPNYFLKKTAKKKPMGAVRDITRVPVASGCGLPSFHSGKPLAHWLCSIWPRYLFAWIPLDAFAKVGRSGLYIYVRTNVKVVCTQLSAHESEIRLQTEKSTGDRGFLFLPFC